MIHCTRSTYIVFLFVVVVVVVGITTSHAFSITTSHGGNEKRIRNSNSNNNNGFQQGSTAVVSVPRTTLFAGFGNTSAAGFNNNNSSKRNKKNKKSASVSASASASLKPKSQWDRFMALKQSTAVKVGVRVVAMEDSSSSSSSSTKGEDEEEGTWMEVGRVRAQDDTFDGQIASLVVQRGLVAEHAKRLYPLFISSKDKLEWGFQSTKNENDDANEQWVAVNVKDVNVDIGTVDVKKIGFEGRPDPASGYYCHYDVSSKGTKVLNLEYE